MSAEIVALMVLIGGIVVAVVFTIAIVMVVDPSASAGQAEGDEEQ